MRHIDPATIPHAESHRYLLSCVAPRPIALAGTMDAQGRPNLSPFSFFNAFGANPPVVAFSPAFRGTDGSPKHSFLNVLATGEFTISAVSYAMAEQVSLASADYPEGVDEYEKAGFTKLPSERVRPFGVAESPFVMECRLLRHVDLGGGPASGNLLIGEVVMFHIRESVFEGKYPDVNRLDLVARMGGAHYCRASGSAVFTLPRPEGLGIGFDQLPDAIRNSDVLTGSDLAKLAGVTALPDAELVAERWRALLRELPGTIADDLDIELRVGSPERALSIVATRMSTGQDRGERRRDLHRVARAFLARGEVERAWECLLGAPDRE